MDSQLEAALLLLFVIGALIFSIYIISQQFCKHSKYCHCDRSHPQKSQNAYSGSLLEGICSIAIYMSICLSLVTGMLILTQPMCETYEAYSGYLSLLFISKVLIIVFEMQRLRCIISNFYLALHKHHLGRKQSSDEKWKWNKDRFYLFILCFGLFLILLAVFICNAMYSSSNNSSDNSSNFFFFNSTSNDTKSTMAPAPCPKNKPRCKTPTTPAPSFQLLDMIDNCTNFEPTVNSSRIVSLVLLLFLIDWIIIFVCYFYSKRIETVQSLEKLQNTIASNVKKGTGPSTQETQKIQNARNTHTHTHTHDIERTENSTILYESRPIEDAMNRNNMNGDNDRVTTIASAQSTELIVQQQSKDENSSKAKPTVKTETEIGYTTLEHTPEFESTVKIATTNTGQFETKQRENNDNISDMKVLSTPKANSPILRGEFDQDNHFPSLLNMTTESRLALKRVGFIAVFVNIFYIIFVITLISYTGSTAGKLFRALVWPLFLLVSLKGEYFILFLQHITARHRACGYMCTCNIVQFFVCSFMYIMI